MLYKILFPLFLLILNRVLACQENCLSCSNTNSTQKICYSCNTSFQLTENGLCVSDRLIKDCAKYDKQMNCIQCRPTFQLRFNSCIKMYNGCFIFNGLSCEVCLSGGYTNGDGNCLINYLNCIVINDQGQCSKCQVQYNLIDGKCIYNNIFCLNIDKDTGQCTLCSVNSVMVGSSCIPLTFQTAINNCYFANIFDNQTKCQYCKEGYATYYGSCLLIQEIIKQQNYTNQCKTVQYFLQFKDKCFSINKTQISIKNCLSVDYGYKNCLFCKADHILINGTCISIRNNFCQVFQANSQKCKSCKNKFHNKNGVCYENPLFCNNYTDKCNSCINAFQLINGRCRDPNCRLINTITQLCRSCHINYRLNSQGICKFIDPNCQEFNSLSECSLCLKNFILKTSNKICTFPDVNCISFDEFGACAICKPFFYYNENVELCIPLPSNCQKVESVSGRCSQCLGKFTLISNYQCIFIPKVNNCNIVDRFNHSKCFQCGTNYYSNEVGVCQKLPKFCLRYDSKANRCLQCSASGVMSSKFRQQGVCLDKNCQIFDDQQNCLACLSSYQFDNFGQCILIIPDPNCRQFSFGICRSCTQRYFFNSEFICTPVSPLCKEYDLNSGFCISCYQGYLLTDNGQCVINFYTQSMAGSVDLLQDNCKTYNINNQCIQCQPGFQTIPQAKNKEVVTCVYLLKKPGKGNCLQLDKTTNKCIQCVARMYSEDGVCKQIDPNCQLYNISTGVCNKCYPGYQNIQINEKISCMISETKDPNCQKTNQNGCSKCYNGFYHSSQQNKCIVVNNLCQTYDPKNGFCLTCFSGYFLDSGNCQIKTQVSSQNKQVSKQQVENCLHYESKEKCKTCQWGYALINNQCIKKDSNCQVFVSQNSLECLKCYGGYKIFSRTKLCVLESMIVQKCTKYSNEAVCENCAKGYILNKNTDGIFPAYDCQKIDQNCQIYNAASRSCDKCFDGSVIQGRTCLVPLYGVDENCVVYSENKLCSKCKQGWELKGHLCSQNQ